MISFSFRKINFIIDFSFFAVTALLCLIGGGENIAAAFSVCLIHEAGHLIPMAIYGEKINSVRISGCGIRIIPFKNPLKPFIWDIVILSGGSFLNITTGFIILAFCGKMKIFAVMNIILGIFNLLPYRSFDGGEIILTLISCFGGENLNRHSLAVMRFVSFMISAVILLTAIKYRVLNLTLAVTLIYLAILSF